MHGTIRQTHLGVISDTLLGRANDLQAPPPSLKRVALQNRFDTYSLLGTSSLLDPNHLWDGF